VFECNSHTQASYAAPTPTICKLQNVLRFKGDWHTNACWDEVRKFKRSKNKQLFLSESIRRVMRHKASQVRHVSGMAGACHGLNRTEREGGSHKWRQEFGEAWKCPSH
jgi:hypothetical protein